MKYLRLFESESSEDKFLNIVKEPISLIWDVVHSYEDDGKVSDIDVAVLSISTTNIPLICCIFRSPENYHFEKMGMELFASGRPIEYSISLSINFHDLSDMYEEVVERLSATYEIEYINVNYLDPKSNNWKEINTKNKIVELLDNNRSLFSKTPIDLQIAISK